MKTIFDRLCAIPASVTHRIKKSLCAAAAMSAMVSLAPSPTLGSVNESGEEGYIRYLEIRVSWILWDDTYKNWWADMGDDWVESSTLYQWDSVNYWDEAYWYYHTGHSTWYWAEDQYYVSSYDSETIAQGYSAGAYTMDFWGAAPGSAENPIWMEPFEVTAEPYEAWELDWENVWVDFVDRDFWEDLDIVSTNAWGAFLAAMEDLFEDTGSACDQGLERAHLAQLAYGSPPSSTYGNYSNQSHTALNIQESDLVDSESGFKAVVYKNSVTGTLVVSFAGSNGLSDWGQNIAQSFGIATTQYNKAASLASIMATYAASQSPALVLEFVGHSLGGGLASLAALKAQKQAWTFNAAGLHSETVDDAQTSMTNAASLISAFYVGGELLSTAQDSTPLPNAAGTRHRLAPASGLDFWEPFEKHGIQSVIDSFDC